MMKAYETYHGLGMLTMTDKAARVRVRVRASLSFIQFYTVTALILIYTNKFTVKAPSYGGHL